MKSRHALASGLSLPSSASSPLESDDFDAAADSSARRPATWRRPTTRVGGPLAAGAAFVPILAQHRAAVVDMSRVGSAGAATVAEALDEIDLDALRPSTAASTSTPWPPSRPR